MLAALRAVIADLLTPSVGSPYQRGVIGISHAMLGAACVDAFGWRGMIPAITISLCYMLVKEYRDIRHGGRVWDGVEDTGFVLLGALYGYPGWPVAVILTGFGVMVLSKWRQT